MKRFSLLIIASVLFFLFLIIPDTVQKAAYESVLFCSAVVIPSLFPGFVLSNLILSLSTEGSISGRKGFLSRIFQPPAGVRCWLIGLLAGFPAAADCTCRMYASGILTKDEGEGHNEMCPEWLKFVQVSVPWLESCLCASLAMNAAVELQYSLLNVNYTPKRKLLDMNRV